MLRTRTEHAGPVLDDECRACVAFQMAFQRRPHSVQGHRIFEDWVWSIRAATVLGTHTRGETVVAAGSTDWAHGLRGKDSAVERITKNVRDRLGK